MKPRVPGSLEDALTIIYGLIGVDGAARAVERSEQHVRRWSDPDDDSLPNLKQALQLEVAVLRASGQMPLTDAMLRWMKNIQAVEAIPARKVEPVGESVMDVTVQLGALTASVRDALSDRKLSAAERNRILRQIAQLRQETDDLERSVMAVDTPSRRGVGS